jgi:hypothetical protein
VLNNGKNVLLKLLFNKKHKIMKLSLDALKERAEATASTELLATISGGTENGCHTLTDKEMYESFQEFLKRL